MIKKYIKKPIPIEAVQWTGNNDSEIINFAGKNVVRFYDVIFKNEGSILIKTLEGTHKASVGDYIIKGVHGEFYPCKEDIFKETYEEVKS